MPAAEDLIAYLAPRNPSLILTYATSTSFERMVTRRCKDLLVKRIVEIADKTTIPLRAIVYLDDLYAGTITTKLTGFLFNKAGNARTWEVGYVYQKAEKDGVYSGFHDSDFGGGLTDTDGGVLKAAFVPATGWTLNAQYFMNQRFIDSNDTTATRKYNRLQLDLNYKF
jgi:hypothetical protein